MMDYIGIDIGSTAAKVCVRGPHAQQFVLPTGWSSRETADEIGRRLTASGIRLEPGTAYTVATGYGRGNVVFADRAVTEITCHARAGAQETGGTCTLIDIGGQDTKVIRVEGGVVTDFLMNDKCAAGTGKFLEIMANRLCVGLEALFALAEAGTPLSLSALCTVFAESEVISYIGEGRPRPDIAAGVIDSVAAKVATLCSRQALLPEIRLTGGLCHSPYFVARLAEKLGHPVQALPGGQFAGAYGASLIAQKQASSS